jgi:hypothetical protein
VELAAIAPRRTVAGRHLLHRHTGLAGTRGAAQPGVRFRPVGETDDYGQVIAWMEAEPACVPWLAAERVAA